AGCKAGKCAVATCKAGWADCDKQFMNGCEINVNGDPANCNACGNACGAVPNGMPGCNQGQCGVGACNVGYSDCNGMAADGCECNTASGFACAGGACLP